MNSIPLRDMEQHVTILGWILIVTHAIFLAIGAFVFLLLTGIGAVSASGEAMAVLTLVATLVAVLMGILALPGIAAGYGLLKRKQWGRVAAIVVAALNLLNIPIGTALGIYALWVLMQESANTYFTTASSPATS